jgi:uncharacterized protein
MPIDLIRYDLLVQDALRGVVRQILSGAARDGLPGDHHFYISFRTHARGVRLSARMRELYPDEMTIILQHQFWDLRVGEDSFEVGLSFRNLPEMLLIPFEAVTRFFDPSVGFEAKFAVEDEATESETTTAEQERPQPAPLPGTSQHEQNHSVTPETVGAQEPPIRQTETKVVSIDAFRKKS